MSGKPITVPRLFDFKAEGRSVREALFVLFLEHFLSKLVQICFAVADAVCLMSKVVRPLLSQTSDHPIVATKAVECFPDDAFSVTDRQNVH